MNSIWMLILMVLLGGDSGGFVASIRGFLDTFLDSLMKLFR